MIDRKQYVPNTVKHGKQTRGETEDGTLWVQYKTAHGDTRDVLRVSSKSCNPKDTVDGTVSEPYPGATADPL